MTLIGGLLCALLLLAFGQQEVMRMIAFRIQRLSSETWHQLGQPAGRTVSGGDLKEVERIWRSGFALTSYVLFTNGFRSLGDAQLTRMIWLARALTVLGMTGTVALGWFALASA